MPTRGDRHLRAVQLAKQLAALGARLKTIHLVTGIPPRQVQSLFFPDARTIPRGRAPDSAEWYHGANLILRSDACLIGARYRQLRNQGLASGEAMVFAYRAYQAATLPPYRISLAIPTAMPVVPLSRIFGRRAGSIFGSCMVPSKFGT